MLKQLEQLGTLEELKHYKCKAISLSDSLPTLGIRVYHHETPGLRWTLYFMGVYYYQGPIFWTGANFFEAPKEISFDVWRRVNPNISDMRLEQVNKLFPVCMLEIAPQPILIACTGVSVSTQEIYPNQR